MGSKPLTDPSDYARQLEQLHAEARDIFGYALHQSSIPEAFDRHLHFEGTQLVLHPFPNVQRVMPPTRVDLAQYKSVLVIALGKAANAMLDTLLLRLPRRLKVRGVCCAPDKPQRRSWRFHYFAGGHPLPNSDSLKAARTALRLLRRTSEKTFVFFLISGGGSAMFELPADPAITLEDTVAFHEALVGCGAAIHEINIVRKHFSAVKGGRLSAAAPCARKITLQLADVPLRRLDALASAPTLPDRSTLAECREVLARYGLLDRFPPAVRNFFSRHLSEQDLPAAEAKNVQDPFAPERSTLDTLLSNHDLVNAARTRAHALGYRIVIDNTCDDWPYEKAAAYLIGRFAELRTKHPRLCLLSGGEVTVRLPGSTRATSAANSWEDAASNPAVGGKAIGTGGRNQQFALACAQSLHAQFSGSPVVVLSAGSDGVDGNSSAAGALADPTTVSRSENFGFRPAVSLERFDACPLFSALGDTVVTGPTGNNLRDLRILLSAELTQLSGEEPSPS
ncbi:MAG: glycerate kinase type-2 family protein [Acidobacteriaceae bacterium]